MDGNHVKTRLVQGTPCWKMTVSLLVALMLASVLAVGVLPAYAEDMQEASAALEEGGGTRTVLPSAKPIAEVFPDAELAKFVAEKLGKNVSDAVTQDDLDTVTVLKANKVPNSADTPIYKLDGIEYLRNLKHLEIVGFHGEEGQEYTLSWLHGLAPDLTVLNISNTAIAGVAEDFKAWPGLQCIGLVACKNIEGTLERLVASISSDTYEISIGQSSVCNGDISCLAPLANLKVFNAEYSNGALTGDVSTFAGLPNLVSVSVGGAGLTGDIRAFVSLPQIEGIALEGTAVTGDIGSLSSLVNIQKLALAGLEGVTGDIRVLQNMQKLVEINLVDTKVTGDIAVLATLPDVQMAELGVEGEPRSGGLTGDISSLASFQFLELSLENQNVTGDVKALGQLTESRYSIILNGTGVSGNIADALKGCSYDTLGLEDTFVEGDLEEAFNGYGAKDLEIDLRFSNTNVSGDIAAFSVLSGVKAVSMDNTNVHGNLVDMFDPEKSYDGLVVVSAQNTNIHGTLKDLEPLSFLFTLRLNNTDVTGDLGEFARAHSDLNEVSLVGTGVTGDPSELLSLQQIEKVDLSGLAITLDTLTFANEPVAVAIPVQYEGEALDPLNVTGGTGAKSGNQMVWQVPVGENGQLSYTFEKKLSFGDSYEGVFSGTVTQAYTAPAPPVPVTAFTITATAGEGGTISPAGDVIVEKGGTRTFTIAANSGYTIKELRVDGQVVKAAETYTFADVQADHSLEAVFAKAESGGKSVPATGDSAAAVGVLALGAVVLAAGAVALARRMRRS